MSNCFIDDVAILEGRIWGWGVLSAIVILYYSPMEH